MTRGLFPAAVLKTYLPKKRRKKFFKKSSLFSKRSLYPRPFSAALRSSHSQQPFSAALLSSHSQQPLSAALFSSHSQQPLSLSAALLSSHSEAILSSSSQQPFSAIILLWSGVGGQLLSSATIIMLLWSRVGGQLLSSCWCGLIIMLLCYHHVAVVKGWWSAIIIMLLWSGVGGLVLSSCCGGQGLVVNYCHQLLSSCCCGQGLVVSLYHNYHHLTVVRSLWSTVLTFFRRTLSQRFSRKIRTAYRGSRLKPLFLQNYYIL